MYADSLVQITHATHNDRFSFPAPLCKLCVKEKEIAQLDHSDMEELEVVDYE